MRPSVTAIGSLFVPLDFLKRKGSAPAPKTAAPATVAPAPVPEEAVAQEDSLRLTFGAKTSSGVRLEGGPEVLAALPSMLNGIALTPVEVVQPRDSAEALPNIVRTNEATAWLQAHGASSPITRHALYVLETLDAIDPAYDTFACALLDGDRDSGGYPEYAAIIGGVAAHWDESTGDLIVRGVVGWGGKGTRGDTDRIANRLLQNILGAILESGTSLGVAAADRPAPSGENVTCKHCGYPLVHARAVYCPKCGMRMHGA